MPSSVLSQPARRPGAGLPEWPLCRNAAPHQTVVAATTCQHQAGPGSTGNHDSYVWYYGGRGTQVGDPVEDGSVTPPEEDTGGGSGGGNSGDTGDDGGDDGGDSGGGDGGD